MEMKYIVVKDMYEDLIIFPRTRTHASMADKFHGKVVAAGFFQYDVDNGPMFYGKSDSLGISSRDTDKQLFLRHTDMYS